jgi:hypothetical protein
MMHSQIENEESVERYVRNRLAPEERHAFEEHFLGCEECFEKVQTMERFLAGIRDAADRGLLNDESRPAFAGDPRTWFRWAFAATTCAALVFAVMTGWIYLIRMPKLRGELDRTSAQLQEERRLRAELEQRPVPVEQAEANVPLVMLQASRADEEPATVVLQPGARHLVLWIEMSRSRYRDFRLEVFSEDGRLVTSVDHLQRGAYGALAASLPVNPLPNGDFRIKLSGQNPQPASLAGEYRVRIRRP